MTMQTVPSLAVPEAFSHWLESRGLIYQLLVDFWAENHHSHLWLSGAAIAR